MDGNSANVEKKSNDIMDKLSKFKLWLEDRLLERTTVDGYVLVVLGIAVLMFENLLPIFAWVSILYGIYTIFKKEKKIKL